MSDYGDYECASDASSSYSDHVSDAGVPFEDRYPGRVVKHTQLGVWDWYEEQDPDNRGLLFYAALKKHSDRLVKSAPYLGRMVQDVLSVPGGKFDLFLFVVSEFGGALVPVLSLWFQGRLVALMETTLDTRVLDTEQLLYISAGRVACSLAAAILQRIRTLSHRRLDGRVRRLFASRTFRAHARLDLATFSRQSVQAQLAAASEKWHSGSLVWHTLENALGTLSGALKLGAQAFVLWRALRGQADGAFLTGVTLLSETIPTLARVGLFSTYSAWAVTTKNRDYLKLLGWEKTVQAEEHRKEIVAGNLAEYAVAEYEGASSRLGSDRDHWQEIRQREERTAIVNVVQTFMKDVLGHLPQLAFTLRALRNPMSVPASLASLALVQSAARECASTAMSLVCCADAFSRQLISLREVYEITNIRNVVVDGSTPFPENAADVRSGIGLEFRNVTFRYPGVEKYALRNVSFKLLPGQLCVIVGSNGAGKSTILKLIVRLYDPEEGEILIGGHDIRTLRLRDLRQAISVLFQDYTHFPLSIRDNIALGDPCSNGNDDHVRLAARLGGAEAFIEQLPDGMDTYLRRPVGDSSSGEPRGSKTALGNTFDVCAVRAAAGIRTATKIELSGGQMQRLAVARTFMRSVVAEDSAVGMLLFDEPSASLDPAAEHDLFERLRRLRGEKTMVFSSHRFGNLTRHADLILYMDESGIVESGTHSVLLERQGEYSRLWTIQAQAFL